MTYILNRGNNPITTAMRQSRIDEMQTAYRFDRPDSSAYGATSAPSASPAPADSLRILHLNSLLRGGGTDDQCIQLAKDQRQLGHSVWIAGPGDGELSPRVRKLDVQLHATPTIAPVKLRFILSAAQLVRRERIQIVHAHHGRDYWPAVLVARLSGVHPGIVMTRHLAKSPRSWMSRKFLLRQCDALIAVSDFTARVLKDGMFETESTQPERRVRLPIHGKHSKIYVVHAGIDTRRFRPLDASQRRREWGLAPEHFVFAVAGDFGLPRGKGQREFLQAAARIHRNIPHARFLLIGRGNMKSILQDDIQHLGLTGKAWLIPHCDDMPAAMNAIDCLVHPAVGTEAFGLVVCEAHACGRPVIASALDGIPEAFHVGGCGSLVQPGNVEKLSLAMRTWVARPPLTEPARQALHDQIAERLGVAANARQVLAIYQSILADGQETAYGSLPQAQSGVLQP